MGSYHTRGLVLKSRNLGEADRVLVLLTEDYRKCEAVVKGARRQRSRFIGNTLPFNLINGLFFTGKNLDQLSQVELIHSFAVLREDLVKMAYASYWAELIAEFLPERENVTEIFRFLLAALITLEKTTTPDLLSLAFQMRLLNYLGYQPQLDGCTECGKEVSGKINLSVRSGGTICDQCASQCTLDLRQTLIVINPAELVLLRSLTDIDIRQLDRIPLAGVNQETIRALLRSFIEERLDHPLKSLAFLESVLS
jgi:DNA repair protein RecO (recombination protein O)